MVVSYCFSIAKVKTSARATLPQVVLEPSCTGEDLLTASPSPNCPFSPRPHTHKVLSVFLAMQKLLALFVALADDQSVSAPTCTGEETSIVLFWASWPWLFLPQTQRVPSVFIALVEEPPASALSQVVNAPTCTGED
jgi:hypothetical protein